MSRIGMKKIKIATIKILMAQRNSNWVK